MRGDGRAMLLGMLTQLAVPRDRVIYIHSSIDWLDRAGIGVGEALNVLLEWVAKSGGTLVMPAYPFRGSHEAYLQSGPVFDVKRSPARVGLLNETLRRHKGVARSLDPDLSIIAMGPQADAVIGAGLTGPDPTGPDSPFQRIIDLGGVLAGLGVSLNYMNMIHVLDSRYRHRYPFAIYSAKTYVAHSIDHARQSHRVTKLAMLNELQVNIKPSRIVHALHPGSDIFRSAKIGSTDFFIWELAGWEPLCVTHLEQALDAGGVPCWLADVETQIKVSQSMAANNGPRAG